MAEKQAKVLFQVLVPPELERRLKATPEYKLHGKVGSALRSILDRVLPKNGESQEENQENGKKNSD